MFIVCDAEKKVTEGRLPGLVGIVEIKHGIKHDARHLKLQTDLKNYDVVVSRLKYMLHTKPHTAPLANVPGVTAAKLP